MRSDVQIQKDVIDEIRWDPCLTEKTIDVGVESGVVTLTGTVPTYAEKVAALKAAERVGGVRTVADQVAVLTPERFRRTDAELAGAVVIALDADVQIPHGAIQVSVSDGCVTLAGVVARRYERDAASEALRNLAGVQGVSNYIVIEPPDVTPADVTHAIESAFRRSAELDCKAIVVNVAEGRVTLRGTVRCWAERRDAERAAWSAPGVRSVINQLLVGP